MNPDSEQQALAAAVRSLRASPQREAEEHLSNESLLAYHGGVLAADEAEGLREHLARCPDCARRGLDLASFARPEQAEIEPPAQAEVLDWGRTREALAQEGFFDDSRAARPKPGGRRFFAFFLLAISAVRLAPDLALKGRVSGPNPPVEFLSQTNYRLFCSKTGRKTTPNRPVYM